MVSRGWLYELRQGGELLLVGAIGALAGHALGLTAGVIAGALVATGAYRLLGGDPGPWQKRYGRAGRLLLGTVIGAAFDPELLAPLQAAVVPMVGLIVVIVAVGLLLGLLLSRLTKLDRATAIISAMPGGLLAMAAIADDTGADPTVVASIHFSRLTTIFLVVPLLIPLLTGTSGRVTADSVSAGTAGSVTFLAALALGLLGGLLALRTGVPTADLVGPILAVGGANLLGAGLGPLPAAFRNAAILFIGTAVGTQVSGDSLRQLRQVAVPAASMIATLIGVGLLLGWGLAQITPLDPVTALLCAVPGGASTMPIIAHDLGGDIRLVATLQLTRQLAMLVIILPTIGLLARSQQKRRLAVHKR